MQFELIVNSLSLLEMIPVVLVVLLTLWGSLAGTRRSRTLSFLQFLVALCFAGTLLTVTMERYGMLAAGAWTAWGRYVDFGLRGAYLAFLIIYVIMWAFPNFFSERKWAIIVVLIGPIVYETLMFSAFSTDITMYGPAWLVTGLVLAVLYMALIPLYATYVYTRKDRIRGSPQVMWIWVVLIGLLFWFIGEAVLGLSQMLQWPGWNSFFSETGVAIVGTHTIAWYLMLIGFFFQRRILQSART
ncbi:MAG: hypothetical protein ACE5H4_09265 [Candidatus Thorarchaeota archaeon]